MNQNRKAKKEISNIFTVSKSKNFEEIDINNIENIAIGKFDGIHIAHKKLFFELQKKSAEKSAILLIEPYKAILTPNNFREEFINLPFFSYEFEHIRTLSGVQFIEQITSDFINLKNIIVGYDFRFGENRKFSAFDLKTIFQQLNKTVNVQIIDEVFFQNISIHSKLIKDKIKNGNIEKANKLLGHKYKIMGKVIKGQGLGKKELVPTINLQIEDFLLPKNGVYFSITEINSKKYNSISFIGNRQTTDNKYSVETHILDSFFQEHTKIETEVKIEFIKFHRENIKFENLKKLKEQIKIDISKANSYFIEAES